MGFPSASGGGERLCRVSVCTRVCLRPCLPSRGGPRHRKGRQHELVADVVGLRARHERHEREPGPTGTGAGTGGRAAAGCGPCLASTRGRRERRAGWCASGRTAQALEESSTRRFWGRMGRTSQALARAARRLRMRHHPPRCRREALVARERPAGGAALARHRCDALARTRRRRGLKLPP